MTALALIPVCKLDPGKCRYLVFTGQIVQCENVA